MAKVSKVVIAGGGTAGWLAAAALGRQLGDLLDIVLVESDEIGTVGVGEATIPPMRVFHRLLRIDEQAFMRATSATFKLGIHFEDWGRIGDRYIHSFGKTGKETWLGDFHHFWLHGRTKGFDAEYGEYCYEWRAARENRFATGDGAEINFAYHMDATLYAAFLRKFAEGYRVRRVEGKIAEVRQQAESGDVTALVLESGVVVDGDLFIDCTGFRGLLIEQALRTGFDDWSHWLPCDSAVAVQTPSTGPAEPFTRSVAHDAGWRWRIPLQHRVGNGLVYCSRFLDDDAARERLLGMLDAEPITTPRTIKFRTGRRRKGWNRNVIALGLASGFVEPLESTSIHLIMMGITRLMGLFPFDGVNETLVEEYNRQTETELEKIRDFIVLHYHATQRGDSPFWNYCRTMDVPDTLLHRIQLFRRNAQAFQKDGELFRVDSWVQVMLGQGIMPEGYHHIAQLMSDEALGKFLNGLRAMVAQNVAKLPAHQGFVDAYCKMDVK